MSERVPDAFTSVVGVRRGAPEGRATDREPTDLDRARELTPLVADSLQRSDILQTTLALRERAVALGIEVVPARVLAGVDDQELDVCLTLLFSATQELIGAVELNPEGQPVLLRPDAVRWQQR
jgi:hypothetical protein